MADHHDSHSTEISEKAMNWGIGVMLFFFGVILLLFVLYCYRTIDLSVAG